MKKIYTQVIFLSLCLWACDKGEGISISYPAAYHRTRFQNTSPVRLFTQDGEITDQKVVSNFVNRYNKGWLSYDGIYEQIPLQQTDTIEIISEQLAYLHWNGGMREHRLEKLNNKELKFTPKDTMKIVSAADMIGRDITDNQYITQLIEKYDLVHIDSTYVPGPYGFATQHHILVSRLATSTANRLEFPYLRYTVSSGTEFSKEVYSVNVNNRFKESGVTRLRENDTVAVQEFVMLYEK